MLAKKQPPPITTYKNFFKAIEYCRIKYGFKFEFQAVPNCIWDEEGYAQQNCIWYRAGLGTYWNPVEVVHHVFFSKSARLWVPGEMAYKEIGLPQNKYEELVLVYRESRGHYIRLREMMCDALDLEDVPINKRPSYRVIDDMDKRRR